MIRLKGRSFFRDPRDIALGKCEALTKDTPAQTGVSNI